MYPDSVLQWLGACAVVFGVLVGVAVLALWIHQRYGHDDDGRAAVWYAFEVLSAVFVVAGLLTCIYSDSRVLRAVAGIALIALVSTITASAVHRG